MSCWGITDDIKKISLYSENIEKDIMSLRDVYDIKFKELANCVDEVDKNLYNLREAWEEMRPDKVAEREDKLDKDLFGNVALGEDGC
jgi:hypothetical protein